MYVAQLDTSLDGSYAPVVIPDTCIVSQVLNYIQTIRQLSIGSLVHCTRCIVCELHECACIYMYVLTGIVANVIIAI